MDLLEWRARFQSERLAYTFLADNGADRISLSWQQLHRKAQLIGQQLTAMNAAGKTVLLLYPSDPEYVAAFFGCLCGFKAEAFHPCYGLAEATLFVTGKAARGVPKAESFSAAELIKNRVLSAAGNGSEAKRLVSCGVSFGGQRVAVVKPETLGECAAGEVGEIWITGPSVAGGYWRQPEVTAHTFHARLAGDGDEFVRTGDLGFLHEGELYVTGRLKDLIIIRGLNHYPQDIEQTAEFSHAALRPGCSAAFSLEVEGEERLVIVLEVQRKRTAGEQEIVDAIRQRVAEEHEVQVYAVALIRQATIAKTSSGKIQRNACRRAFVVRQLEVEYEWRETANADQVKAAQTKTSENTDSPEVWLQTKLAALLRVDVGEIDVNQPTTRYGLDSLMVVELSHSIEEQFGVAIPLVSLFESVSIRELCERVASGIGIVSADAGQQNGDRSALSQQLPNHSDC